MKAKFGNFLGWLLALGLCSTDTIAQDSRGRLPSPSLLRDAALELPARERQAFTNAADQSFPRFVFIPGILGSKLTKTLGDGRKKVIWGFDNGAFASPEDLAFDPAHTVTADLLEESFRPDRPIDLYGNAIARLEQDIGEKVLTFAYDWRDSNTSNGSRLAEWLCSRHLQDGRPVVFIAHSVGGTLLKHWLKRHYVENAGQCDQKPFRELFEIKKVIFVGTPRYGSPTALVSLVEQVHFLIDPAHLPNRLFPSVGVRMLSAGLSRHSFTFPSTYELVPVVNTTDCFRNRDWRIPIKVRVPGLRPERLGIFETGLWESLRWPNLPSNIDRETFIRNSVPKLLADAKSAACDLASFDVDKFFSVTRLYGNQVRTVCELTIVPQSQRSARIDRVACEEESGDGTVPAWIAGETERTGADTSQPIRASHSLLISSKEFLQYLGKLSNEFRRELAQRMYRQGNLEILRSIYASAGFSARDLYAAAKAEPDNLRRAESFIVFSELAELNDPLRAWALNNAASIHLKRKSLDQARELAERALEDLPELPGWTSRDIRRKSGLIAASATEQLGDVAEAARLRQVALRTTHEAGRQAAAARPSDTLEVLGRYRQIIDTYNPRFHSPAVIQSVLRRLCVPSARTNIVTDDTVALIKVYQQTEGRRVTGLLTERDIDVLRSMVACPVDRGFLNYYEATRRDEVNSADVIDLLNKALPESRKLAKPSAVSEVRARIPEARNVIRARLQITDPQVANQLTVDLINALRDLP